VQVGDPFTEKLLIEACLELMASDAIVAIQDMGAAGLTSSSVEMASKGGVGLQLDLELVPCRETGMTPYEMMLSESQERMLMVLKPGREDFAEAIFRKWELDFAVIGHVTDAERLVLTFHGERVADIPLGPLADKAPLLDRPALSREDYKTWAQVKPLDDIPESTDIGADLLKLLACPDLASKRWIWEQYDHMVGADTLQRPGGDAAVVRVHGTRKALAMTVDCTPRYCYADPYEGGKQAVAESWRNLIAVGARPLAITDCMNFGNPQRPEIMGQFVGCIEGMAEACRALDYPVVSGNVSLYNETDGTGILPTPAIGGVGIIDDYAKMMTIGFKAAGDEIWIVGRPATQLGQSLWLRECCDREDGPPPSTDLDALHTAGSLIASMIADGLITASHDFADGGLAVALAEMALAGGVGAEIDMDSVPFTATETMFSEPQGAFLITVNIKDENEVWNRIRVGRLEASRLGRTGGSNLIVSVKGRSHCELNVSVADLRAAHEGTLPALMAR